MKQYLVEFAINVEAINPKAAAEMAWHLLSTSQILPVATVFDNDGGHQDIDLEEEREESKV